MGDPNQKGERVTQTDQITVVLVTAPSIEVAHSLAHGALEAGLVACVNIIPGITSVYRWKGATESTSEVILICKTTRSTLAELERFVVTHHPYDTPEFVALDPTHVEARYGAWLREAVG